MPTEGKNKGKKVAGKEPAGSVEDNGEDSEDEIVTVKDVCRLIKTDIKS